MDLHKTTGYTWLTRTKAFRQLTKWAFDTCDTTKAGSIGKTELYAGILLVHVQLAKYAGAAACYPPTIQVVYELFDAADDNKSGTIDEDEFVQIVVICCGQITSRIVVYYIFVIVLVPYVADALIRGIVQIDDSLFALGRKIKQQPDDPSIGSSTNWIETILTYGSIAESMVSFGLFVLFVPKFFDWIDTFSRKVASITNAETTTPQLAGDKKEE